MKEKGKPPVPIPLHKTDTPLDDFGMESNIS